MANSLSFGAASERHVGATIAVAAVAEGWRALRWVVLADGRRSGLNSGRCKRPIVVIRAAGQFSIVPTTFSQPINIYLKLLGLKIYYSLLPTLAPISKLGCWESQLPSFTHVVGYSNLGHFFLWNERANEFAVMHPFRQLYKNYGWFDSTASFETAILKDPGFSEYVLKPSHQMKIRDRLGDLAANEVYIPNPYPFLGGSEEPDTYTKGNFWVFAELVGMSHGFR